MSITGLMSSRIDQRVRLMSFLGYEKKSNEAAEHPTGPTNLKKEKTRAVTSLPATSECFRNAEFTGGLFVIPNIPYHRLAPLITATTRNLCSYAQHNAAGLETEC